MTVEPPFTSGAVHDSATCESDGVAVSELGAAGTVLGVALATADAAPVPTAFTARTRYEYAAPFVRPVTTNEFVVGVPTTLHVSPPSDEDSTEYPVTGVPPLDDGACHVSAIDDSPATAPIPNGAEAFALGESTPLTLVVGLEPIAFEALTRTAYD